MGVMGVGPLRSIIEWDYREQPDFERIQRAMHEVFNGSNHPCLRLVDDTGSDQYALVVSSTPITEREAQDIYDAWLTDQRAREADGR